MRKSEIKKIAGRNIIVWFDPLSKKSFQEPIKSQSERQKLVRRFCQNDFDWYRKNNPEEKGPPIPGHAPEGLSISEKGEAFLPMFTARLSHQMIDGRRTCPSASTQTNPCI